MIVLRPETELHEQGEVLLAGYGDCPDCGWKLRLIAPLDDRIHPATVDARPLLLVCEQRERVLHPRVYPGEGDGASAWWPRCDWTRVVGWFARGGPTDSIAERSAQETPRERRTPPVSRR